VVCCDYCEEEAANPAKGAIQMLRAFMLTAVLLTAVSAIMPVTPALGLESRAVQMREDFGNEPLYDCYMNYYYYIPCTTTSWFWMFTLWDPGDKIGAWFQLGDPSMGTSPQCDPVNCQKIEQFRVLDFAGYGSYRPGLYTVRFDIYCADESGCPVGPSMWTSPYLETIAGWNYILVNPPLSLCPCATVPGPPSSRPRVLIVASHVGTLCTYPAWGMDNIHNPLSGGCAMHDNGCLPAPYPRPYNSYYTTMHSGYYGRGSFQYCPPQWFKEPGDSTPNGTQYGYIELAWRIYLA
jgi:hypothetical protein